MVKPFLGSRYNNTAPPPIWQNHLQITLFSPREEGLILVHGVLVDRTGVTFRVFPASRGKWKTLSTGEGACVVLHARPRDEKRQKINPFLRAMA